MITVIGLSVGTLLAGAILTETIFSWPGIGKWMVDSIFRRDYPVVQGGLLLIAVMVMVVNLTVDMLYGVINPQDQEALTWMMPFPPKQGGSRTTRTFARILVLFP